MLRLATLLCFLLSSALLDGAALTALVKDPSGGVVAGALVAAESKTLRAPLKTVTDSEGRARFESLTAGAYRITVSKDGFENWERTVTISANAGDKAIDLNVTLKLKVLTTTVEVSGRRSPLANSDPNYTALRGAKLTKVYRVDNLVLTRDVGTFTFHSGSFSFLPPVLGHVTTGVFVGEGNFQLKPAFEIATKHLQRVAGMDSVDEDFTAMVVYFSDTTFDEIKQHSELADESPQRHEEAFRRVKETIERRREPPAPGRWMPIPLTLLERLLNYEDIPNYDAEILAELYNPAQRGSFRAFLHGRKHGDLRFLLNPRGAMPMLAAPEETALLNFDPNSESDGIWYLSHLASEVKAGRASSNEDKRLIAPEHYKLQALIGKQNLLGTQPELAVTCDLRFRSLENGTRMVKFDLVPDLQVSRVAWNGKDIPFIQESRKQDGSFYLQMPEPLVKGHTYDITFEYAGGEILQSQFGPPPVRRIWYPTPAGSASRATYDLSFHIPHGMNIVTAGDLIKQSREGAYDVSDWTCDVPITQAVFRYFGDFYFKSTLDEATNTQLAAYVSNTGNGIMPSSSGDVLIDTGNAVRVFSSWFGPPAYRSLAVVVGPGTASLPGVVYASPVITAGYSSLVTQSLNRSGGRSAGPPATMRLALDEAFPNQVSRQWFGNTVGSISLHDEWLSSGFANFAASLYDLEAYKKDAEFRDHWVKAREALLVANRFGVKLNDAGPVWMGMLNDTFKTPGAGNTLSASKGGFILHMLRCLMYDQETQDRDFQAMMQEYVKWYANVAVSSEDFIALVEKHMKPSMDLERNHSMNWFFGEWLYGTDVPSYRLEYSLSGVEKGGKPVMTGTLTQSGVSAGFKMPVPFYAEIGGRKILVGTVVMQGNASREFKTTLAGEPKRIMLNLNHDILTDHEEVKLVK